MNHHLKTDTAYTLDSDPIKILKQEHHDTLHRLEMIERTLQYLESLPNETAQKRRRIEQLRLRDWIHELSHRMSLHFMMEEEALYPVLAEYVGEEHGPIEIMIQEHALIKSRFTLWEARVNTLCKMTGLMRETALKGVTSVGHQTIAELRLHISKEDQILFKICEVSFSEEEKHWVSQKLYTFKSL